MATGRDEQVGYSLANVGTVTLEDANERPYYVCIVICQKKIIVLDSKDYKVKIYRLHDGKFLDMLDSDSMPIDICLMDATTICVLHRDGLIEMASIKSEDMSPVFTRMKSFRLDGVFDYCVSVVRVKDNIVVVGVKQDTTYWCIVSLDDGHVDTIHRICKESKWSYLTTKDNIIYISCYAGDADDDTGVYAFDILNPSQCKYKYKHQRLDSPTSIVINEDWNIFVGSHGVLNPCIHQLTASCQLVAIFTEGIPWGLQAVFWDNGRLYVACWGSHDITVFRHVYQGSHKESEVLVSDERKLPGIEESAIYISQGNVDNGQSSVETETTPSGPSPEDSEDEKQASAGPMPSAPISDKDRFMCIAYLLNDVGSKVLRQLFHDMVTPTCTLDQHLANNRSEINKLLKKKVLNVSQMDIMFPPNGDPTNLPGYDITLLSALFNNIMPSLGHQEKNLIKSLRDNRNKLYGHTKSCKMNASDFYTCWSDISSILKTLSQQCVDTKFKNEISMEIQQTQVPDASYLSMIHTLYSRIERLESNKTSTSEK